MESDIKKDVEVLNYEISLTHRLLSSLSPSVSF